MDAAVRVASGTRVACGQDAIIEILNRRYLFAARMESRAMHVASVTLRVRPEKRHEALSAIDELMRRMRSSPGCLACRLLADTGDDTNLRLVSEWKARLDLEQFLASREFQVLQGMRILLRAEPEAILDEVVLRAPMPFARRGHTR
jgi:quinol monooxygenase YgiN